MADHIVDIQKANLDDIGMLVRIHRDGFPDAVSYHVPKLYNKRWWSFVITCPYVEIYVVNLNNHVVGAATIVIDETLYSKEKKQNYPPLLIRILTLITSPKLLMLILKQRICSIVCRRTESSTLSITEHSIYSNRIWIEPIVISARYRRMNLAKQLLSFIERRAIEIKKDVINISVDAKNSHAISFYESQNFKLYGKDKMNFLYYRKLLSNKM
jgi:hypothetical protein